MNKEAVMTIELKGIKLFKRGKVRDIYEIDDKLLIVATDRISAFDVVMPNGIPDKGKVLTQISSFWFDFTKDVIENHLITDDFEEVVSYNENLKKYKDILEGRSMLVKKTEPIPIECVVRGYLAGSGWKDYKREGGISGIQLPRDLKQAQKISKPIFTPSTKAETGHDEHITQEQSLEIVSSQAFDFIKSKSIQIYEKAADFALSKGVIIADTKFEFGKVGDKIILIDEILTPDSSRFWPKDEYEVGREQRSFDKQFTRDYLDSLDWDKTPPAPMLPEDIIDKTRSKYLKILEMITDRTLS